MATLRSLVRVPASTAPELAVEHDPARLHPALRRLVDAGTIGLDDAARAQALAEQGNERLASLLQRTGLVKPKTWAEALAAEHGVKLLKGDEFPESPLLNESLSARFLRHHLVLPVDVDETTVWLAMADPGDLETLKAVRLATGRDVVPQAAALDDLEPAFSRLLDGGRGALQRLVDDLGEGGPAAAGDLEQLIDLANEAPVVRFVDQLTVRCGRAHASDIHIEPFEDRLRVRYRVDGGCSEARLAAVHRSRAVISRIKIMAQARHRRAAAAAGRPRRMRSRAATSTSAWRRCPRCMARASCCGCCDRSAAALELREARLRRRVERLPRRCSTRRTA